MDYLSRLIDAFRCLPGVGPKSAQRIAFHLLQHQRPRGLHLASCLGDAMNNIVHCRRCNNYASFDLCNICQNTNREASTLCIVESPMDVSAIEQSGAYKGCYFVLMGKISPLDGIGPDDIGLAQLEHLVKTEAIDEIILALSPTIEGQTTVHFIQDRLRLLNVNISQLAHGIPAGGELEYLDSHTISSALRNRALLTPHLKD